MRSPYCPYHRNVYNLSSIVLQYLVRILVPSTPRILQRNRLLDSSVKIGSGCFNIKVHLFFVLLVRCLPKPRLAEYSLPYRLRAHHSSSALQQSKFPL